MFAENVVFFLLFLRSGKIENFRKQEMQKFREKMSQIYGFRVISRKFVKCEG